MPPVAVVTDSCASIPSSMMDELNIHWVPYYIHCEEETWRDRVTIREDQFYRWLSTADSLPHTAAPGAGEYRDLYRRLAAEGATDIISIHMTSLGSGAYQAACIARDMARESDPQVEIAVIDTRNVSMCQGWMAIEAARAAGAGRSLGQIVDRVREMMPVTRMLQTADTLEYLYKGGRIGRAAHLLGSLLTIRPVIGMEDGEIVALGRARGRKRAYRMMVDLAAKAVGAGGSIKIAYTHAAAPAEVETLRAMVEERFTCVESLVAELSPALGVHTGPGTAGFCYFPVN